MSSTVFGGPRAPPRGSPARMLVQSSGYMAIDAVSVGVDEGKPRITHSVAKRKARGEVFAGPGDGKKGSCNV